MGNLLAWIRCFVRVAEAGSFSVVARELATTQPTISRQIAALEAHLGSLLLQRNSRGLSLTDDGATFYAQAVRVLEALDDAQQAVGDRALEPSGLLKMACPTAFSRIHIAPRLERFLRQHRRIRIELVMGEVFSDLIEEGLDLAVRIGELSDPGLVARPLGYSERITCASPAYLRRHGEPLKPADLADHECLLFTRIHPPNRWSFAHEGRTETVNVDGRLRSNNSEALRIAATDGLGITILPTWHFQGEPAKAGLTRVLQSFEPMPLPIHAVYASRRFVAPKVRAMIDFLVKEFASESSLQRGQWRTG
ncbi:MAG: LysR family transcriptional regulator [Xanthomonadales bacterium]|nr:LysR family transcriptional regulator [Xanthomonadales bacterium]